MRVSTPDQVRCPTCRAVQEWSDTCRRCRCDLRLLRAAHAAYRDHRRQCLLSLDAGHEKLALGHAIRCHDLRPGPDSRRLIALCALVMEDWQTALELALADGQPD
jgi:hypothetical protein